MHPMTRQEERNVIEEFIDLYRDLPCLWDSSSEDYKSNTKRKTGWGILVEKLKQLDPNANELSAKKKVEHLKYSYQREAKKIKDSQNRTGSGANDVYRPSLWYYDHLTFLEKKTSSRREGHDTFSDEYEDTIIDSKNKKPKEKKRSLEEKKGKLIDTAQALLLQTENNKSSFGNYVTEKLNKTESGQREIAEKLISDVLFLALTNNLRFDSRIETQSHRREPHFNPSSYFPPSPRSSSELTTEQYSPFLFHRKFSPSKSSAPYINRQTSDQPSASIHQPQPSTSHSYQTAHPHDYHSSQDVNSQSPPHLTTSPSENFTCDIQSPPPSSDVHHYHPSTAYPHASQSPLNLDSQSTLYPSTSPSTSFTPHIQSPPPSSDVHHYHISTAYTRASQSPLNLDSQSSLHPTTSPSTIIIRDIQFPLLSSEIHHYPPSTAHPHASQSSQALNSQSPLHPGHIQSPPSSSEIHHYPPSTAHPHASQSSQELNSQSPLHPGHIQSPPSSSEIRHYPPSTAHPHAYHSSQYLDSQSPPRPTVSPSTISALSIQSPQPSSKTPRPHPHKNHYHELTDTNKAVFYAQGPAGEVLKEMLIFKKK